MICGDWGAKEGGREFLNKGEEESFSNENKMAVESVIKNVTFISKFPLVFCADNYKIATVRFQFG